MEYHAVPPEERAKDQKGNPLPWGYVYKDDLRNPRKGPEETGPFGKKRNVRFSSARTATRTATPAARRDNPNVAEFTRLFAQEQQQQQQQQQQQTNDKIRKEGANGTTSETSAAEKVATECILYGYKSKDLEWKAIDKYERISGGFICEDYPRADPDMAPRMSQGASGADVVIRANLTPDANRKSKRYDGGLHWIKVTFDSLEAADQACHFSPQELDGHMVFCELYRGHGPKADAPIPKEDKSAYPVPGAEDTLFGPKQPPAPSNGKTTATSAFPHLGPVEYPNIPSTDTTKTLRDPASPSRPFEVDFRREVPAEQEITSSTIFTATTGAATSIQDDFLRKRPAPLFPQNQPSRTPASPDAAQQAPTATAPTTTGIPGVRQAVLRPMSEALPPQPTMVERVMRSVPILNWFTGDIVGEGPTLKDDGSFDYEKSSLYWKVWYVVDQILGTDLCGLKE